MGSQWLAVTRGGAVPMCLRLLCSSSFTPAGRVPVNCLRVPFGSFCPRASALLRVSDGIFLLLPKRRKTFASSPSAAVQKFQSARWNIKPAELSRLYLGDREAAIAFLPVGLRLCVNSGVMLRVGEPDSLALYVVPRRDLKPLKEEEKKK